MIIQLNMNDYISSNLEEEFIRYCIKKMQKNAKNAKNAKKVI